MPNYNESSENLISPPGTLLIEYLGQAGYRMKGNTTTILIDPYLSNYVVDSGTGSAEIFRRDFPPPENPQEMQGIDFVFITHDHADHCDPQTLVPLTRANPNLKIISPPSAVRVLQAAGIPPSFFQVPVEGQWAQERDLAFTAIPSAHYSLEIDPATQAHLYLGYVIRINHVTLYHSGDTILYPGMCEKLNAVSDAFDIVCLPVNGRDAKREQMGITGNLDAAEALELTRQLKARVLLPMHNDLFAANRIPPGILADLAWRRAPQQRIHWLQPGELYWYFK